jgi:hypothetical protein
VLPSPLSLSVLSLHPSPTSPPFLLPPPAATITGTVVRSWLAVVTEPIITVLILVPGVHRRHLTVCGRCGLNPGPGSGGAVAAPATEQLQQAPGVGSGHNVCAIVHWQAILQHTQELGVGRPPCSTFVFRTGAVEKQRRTAVKRLVPVRRPPPPCVLSA